MTRTVWHLISNRWNSAVTEYALSSARSLSDKGWTTRFFCLKDKPAYFRAQKYQLSLVPLASFGLNQLPKLMKLYFKERPDLILVYGGPETFLTRFFPGAHVVRFRGQDRDLVHPPSPLFYRLSQSHLAGVVTPSVTVAKAYSLSESNISAITLGCDTEKFYLSSKERFERPTLTVLGRLDPIKGHGPFFLWFKMLKRVWPTEAPQPLLKIVGEPANIPIEDLKGFAQDVGLVEGEDWELVSERVSNISDLLSRTHVGVIPSQGSEVICRVAEEFLLAGTPLFVSGVGSLEDCLVDTNAGVSYRGMSGDKAVSLLKDLLLKSYLESYEERWDRSQRAKKSFSLSTMGDQLEKFFLQVGPNHLRGLEPSAAPTKP